MTGCRPPGVVMACELQGEVINYIAPPSFPTLQSAGRGKPDTLGRGHLEIPCKWSCPPQCSLCVLFLLPWLSLFQPSPGITERSGHPQAVLHSDLWNGQLLWVSSRCPHSSPEPYLCGHGGPMFLAAAWGSCSPTRDSNIPPQPFSIHAVGQHSEETRECQELPGQ